MKKLLILIGLISSMYAVPPCEHDQQRVCIYLYKGAMSAEANIINMTDKEIKIDVEVTLDGNTRTYKDWTVSPNQPLTMLKSRYDNPNQKPNLSYKNFTYKYVN